ncbi:MAG TPA: Rrf2 family transcriptional regulator [bacterium]
MLTKKAKYALKAALHLARRGEGEAVLIADIAETERIPKKFLESILLTMKNRGILVSRKGRGGGYALARPAGEVSFGEIVRIMDGPLAPVACVSVTAYRPCEECASEETCEVHGVMKRVRDAISEVLDATTLADALRDAAGHATRKPVRHHR